MTLDKKIETLRALAISCKENYNYSKEINSPELMECNQKMLLMISGMINFNEGCRDFCDANTTVNIF